MRPADFVAIGTLLPGVTSSSRSAATARVPEPPLFYFLLLWIDTVPFLGSTNRTLSGDLLPVWELRPTAPCDPASSSGRIHQTALGHLRGHLTSCFEVNRKISKRVIASSDHARHFPIFSFAFLIDSTRASPLGGFCVTEWSVRSLLSKVMPPYLPLVFFAATCVTMD